MRLASLFTFFCVVTLPFAVRAQTQYFTVSGGYNALFRHNLPHELAYTNYSTADLQAAFTGISAEDFALEFGANYRTVDDFRHAFPENAVLQPTIVSTTFSRLSIFATAGKAWGDEAIGIRFILSGGFGATFLLPAKAEALNPQYGAKAFPKDPAQQNAYYFYRGIDADAVGRLSVQIPVGESGWLLVPYAQARLGLTNIFLRDEYGNEKLLDCAIGIGLRANLTYHQSPFSRMY